MIALHLTTSCVADSMLSKPSILTLTGLTALFPDFSAELFSVASVWPPRYQIGQLPAAVREVSSLNSRHSGRLIDITMCAEGAFVSIFI